MELIFFLFEPMCLPGFLTKSTTTAPPCSTNMVSVSSHFSLEIHHLFLRYIIIIIIIIVIIIIIIIIIIVIITTLDF